MLESGEMLESGGLPDWVKVKASPDGAFAIVSGYGLTHWNSHLIQYPTGTIEALTPEQYAECVCDPYEEAARVAEGVRAYDDTLQKSVGARTTGERIAKAIRNLGTTNA
jgi:hypothetical protein